ncbi:hypothetical protein VIGAN_06032300, partial [Vigna angularis var. angularis]
PSKGICTFVHAQRKQESPLVFVVETDQLNTLIILFEFQSNKSELRWLSPVCENAWEKYSDVYVMYDKGFCA